MLRVGIPRSVVTSPSFTLSRYTHTWLGATKLSGPRDCSHDDRNASITS